MDRQAIPKEALIRVAERFSIPVKAVADVALEDPQALIARDKESDYTPANGIEPHPFPRLPLGSMRLSQYGGDLDDHYVDYLREFDARELVNAEAEQGIKSHPTYARYLKWAKAGIEPPYISVYQTDRGRLQSTNRRRTLVAQELGTRIIGWFGPHNPETDLPLKYGDVLNAIRAELEPASANTKKPGGPGF